MKVCIIAPDRIFLTVEATQCIVPTNTGSIGILPNHTPLMTGLDIGVLLLCEQRGDGQSTEWTSMVILGGFALIQEDSMTILVNDAEFGKTIDQDEALAAFQEAQRLADAADGSSDGIQRRVELQRARARYQGTLREQALVTV
jgi:F-type H+-transporting ATPase subunit epsilon